MPKPTDKQLLSCINHLLICGHEEKSTAAYENFGVALQNLVAKISPYYKPDKNGNYKVLSGKHLDIVKKAYQEAIEKAIEFSKVAAEDKNAEGMRYVTEKVNSILVREMKGLSDLMPDDKIYLPKLSESVNTHVVEMNQALSSSNVGGFLSNRIPLSYTTSDGRTVKGFFTENTELNEEQETEDLVKRMTQGNELYERALREMTKNKQFIIQYGNRYHCDDLVNAKKRDLIDEKAELKDLFNTEINEMISDENTKRGLLNDEKFNVMLLQFATAYSRVRFKNTFLPKTAKIEPGSKIETRNAAMSAVADLIGMPDILARSVQMEVKVGGESKRGVFMQFAEGSELNDLKKDNPLVGVMNEKNRPRISENAYLQSSDLMVVDEICGNVDRHTENMMFQVGEENGKTCVTGIIGFDNDCSFGTVPPTAGVHNRMVGPSQIGFVRKKTAEHVLALTKDSLTTVLKGRGLREEEINAAWERTRLLQEELTLALGPKKNKSSITIVNDKFTADDIKKMTEHIKKYPDSYYAQIYNDIKNKVKNIDSNKYAEERQQKLEEKYPIFKKESSKMQSAVMKSIENHEPTIQEKNEQTLNRLTTLDADLRKANSGFFIGSRQFDDVKNTITSILRMENSLSAKPSITNYEKSIETYETLISQTKGYLERKEKKAKDLLEKGKAPSENAKKRTKFVEELLDFAGKRLEVLNSLNSAQKLNKDDTIQTIQTMNEVTRQELLLQSNQSLPNEDNKPEKDDLLAKLYIGKTLQNKIRSSGDDMSTSQLQSFTANRDQQEMRAQVKSSPDFVKQTSSMKPDNYKQVAENRDIENQTFARFCQSYRKTVEQNAKSHISMEEKQLSEKKTENSGVTFSNP